MSIPSVLSELQQTLEAKQISVRPQTYFKSSLTALSHAMEDQVLAGDHSPLVIANFQRERFYRQEAHRYQRIAQQTDQVYVLSAPETEFKNHSGVYETVAFDPQDALTQEWHLVVIGQHYATCLICRERANMPVLETPSEMDSSRRFEGIWTFDRQVSVEAGRILLDRVEMYRPELAKKVAQARSRYLQDDLDTPPDTATVSHTNPDPFVQRLVTYLQAGQYKLIKAYRTLAGKEQKERLVHSMGMAIRQSLNPEAVLQVAVEKLGDAIDADRCLVYRCKQTDKTATVHHEFLGDEVSSLVGETLALQGNPLFENAIAHHEVIALDQITDPKIKPLAKKLGIVSWLLVPIFYHDQLLGMMELHRCHDHETEWTEEEKELVDAIANQVGIALIQAEAYANLEDLNEQLEALDRTRSNLVAITGHELRTPLSTIQVCLESLSSEPDMSPELRQVMLQTALDDAERMRKLVQDFLTLSQLESGRVQWHPEPISLEECILLSVSHARSRITEDDVAEVKTPATANLPMVKADGEWLVEVLAKLLDNALKFTNADGEVKIDVDTQRDRVVEVTITDTGRGIEPNRLETVFDRFYQEEGALRRTTGGTGLGLAICRQIVKRWGGEIWAESAGKDKGSQFHFTIPVFKPAPEQRSNGKKSAKAKSSRRQSKGKG